MACSSDDAWNGEVVDCEWDSQHIEGSAMSVTSTEIQALKDAHRKTWASGDYAVMAEFVTDVGERVVERAGVRAGSDVLDVAAGPATRRSRRPPTGPMSLPRT